MATTFAEVLAEARALLNDPSGAIYVTAPMVTLGNKVYKELQTKLSKAGIGTTKEVSAVIDVPAGTLRLGDATTPPLPTDLLYPIQLKERADGSSSLNDFIDMDEVAYEPTIEQDTILRFWAWREDEIKFVGSTQAREVLIRYLKSLGSITGTGSAISVLNANQWLAQRLASIAALTLGSNPSRAQALDGDLTRLWDDLKGVAVHRNQGRPARRRRTRYRTP